jgi:RNA polymerase sigma factor (sigma-70 family)
MGALTLAATPQGSIAVAGADVLAFEEFFEDQSPALFRRLCLITGNRHDAEELMQDAFLRLYERWEQVQSLDDPEGYLYRTAFRLASRRARRTTMALKRTIGAAPSRDEFAAADARESVRRALAGLAPRQRAALVLTELLDYSSEAAGRALGVKPATVRALASLGRAAMRRALESEDDE